MSSSRQSPRLRDRLVARSIPLVPRRLVRRFAAPYIAGSTLDEAMGCVRALAAQQLATTVDVLGESAHRRHEVEVTTREYLQLVDALATLGDRDLVNVSVKLTALGLSFDAGLAREQLRQVAERARDHGGFVRIDMEDSPWTDATLEMLAELRGEGLTNLGAVIQSYLRRSADDVAELARDQVPVRLVKGIYIEPADIAYRQMDAINTNFVELADTLMAAGSPLALATHDRELVDALLPVIDGHGAAREDYEFQMLLGVTEQLRDELTAAGHRMRIYVPFGTRWYEYSVRRLRENPTVAGYVASDVLRSLRPRGLRRASDAPAAESRARSAAGEGSPG